MTPRSLSEQTVIEARITISPTAPTMQYVDYWGNTVSVFDIHESHRTLTITANSLVETSSAREPSKILSFEELREREIEDQLCEFLAVSRFTTEDPELTLVAEKFHDVTNPLDAVTEVSAYLREQVAYVPGSTTVLSQAIDAWRGRSGVCQDFAHLSITILRNLGIPARYVSGYLFPLEKAQPGERTTGQSHAWVEAFVGEWYAFDPTNGAPVNERHITVARGRDYSDVTPFKGVYHGGALEDLTVEVELTRVG